MSITEEEAAPRVADGVELLGEYEGSGFKEPPSLARRGDGQVVQLTELLYLVAKHANGERNLEAIAEEVSREFGREVSADNVRTLVEDKLRPLGILAAADGSSPQLEKPDPLLALKFRVDVLPARFSKSVAGLFRPLFWPPVVLAALGGLVAFDTWLFLEHGVGQGLREALYGPGMMLLVLGLVIVSAAWHEFGHAAGCAYGGATPGAMGAGIYVAYPAFYTDVTDAYRLGRGGRLRTDLAGVYFNGLFVLATAGVYALTGFEPLLLVIVIQHIEIAHQLLPFLRLDGYYIVADLTGVPDLFSRIKPILAALIPFRKPDPSVTELKWWARAVATVWVVIVIPLLVFQLGLVLLHAPRIFATAFDALEKQYASITSGFSGGDALGAALGIVQSLIVALPLIGIVYTFARLGQRLWTWGWRTTDGRPVLRGGFALLWLGALAGLVYVWLPNGDYEPIRRGERFTLPEGVASAREVSRGRPGVASLQRAEERGDLVVDETEDAEGVEEETTESTTTTSEPVAGFDDVSTTTTEGGTDTTSERSTTTTTEASQ